MTKELVPDNLYSKIAGLLQSSRQNVVRVVNQTMVYTYFEIGRMIVEDEQQGKDRAEYGKQVLKELSKQLTADFGKGFSEDNLGRMKNFYLIYSNPISAKGLRKLETAGTNRNLISRKSNAELQQSESNDITISSTPLTKKDK